MVEVLQNFPLHRWYGRLLASTEAKSTDFSRYDTMLNYQKRLKDIVD